MMIAQVSQKQEILSYLHQIDPTTSKRRTISPLEAMGLFRCYRLAARIQELRQDGHKIKTEIRRETTHDHKAYARYRLER